MFFDSETKTASRDALLSATNIREQMIKSHVKMNFQFLDAVLPYFTDLNVEMQSSRTKIHCLCDSVCTV